jgi:N-acyl-D-aspartate/D-glutamate deacylase
VLKSRTITRRDFVATAGVALVAASCGPFVLGRRKYDLVIRGGTVFDGLGGAGRALDIGVRDGRIVAIASKLSAGRDEIDAKGLAVSPGFVDIHSHGDGNMREDPRQESLIRQGITTIVVGQDGGSVLTAPILEIVDRIQPSVNVASMVGLGSIRAAIVGDADRPATPGELVQMAARVATALTQGACGASSGLEYTPGAFASREELIGLCRPLASRRLPYATHMRNEDDQLLESIDESIAVARGAGCPLQISHLKTQGPRNWSKLDAAFDRIAESRRIGPAVDVMFDRYPYIAYQTGLTNLFPVWARDGGTAPFLVRLTAPDTAPRIKTESIGKVDLIGGWDNVHIASVRDPADKPAEGKRLGAYARAVGIDPYELAVQMLKRNNASVGMVGFAMSEENLDRILAHPLGMVCSDGGSFATDGPTRRGSPHPRGAGSFPRVISRYVRERQALTLEQAIHKMTALPASRIRVADRGRIAQGAAADIVVFDAATIADTATYEQPFSYPVGVAAVVVNGVVALRDGQRNSQRSGWSVTPNG